MSSDPVLFSMETHRRFIGGRVYSEIRENPPRPEAAIQPGAVFGNPARSGVRQSSPEQWSEIQANAALSNAICAASAAGSVQTANPAFGVLSRPG